MLDGALIVHNAVIAHKHLVAGHSHSNLLTKCSVEVRRDAISQLQLGRNFFTPIDLKLLIPSLVVPQGIR